MYMYIRPIVPEAFVSFALEWILLASMHVWYLKMSMLHPNLISFTNKLGFFHTFTANMANLISDQFQTYECRYIHVCISCDHLLIKYSFCIDHYVLMFIWMDNAVTVLNNYCKEAPYSSHMYRYRSPFTDRQTSYRLFYSQVPCLTSNLQAILFI